MPCFRAINNNIKISINGFHLWHDLSLWRLICYLQCYLTRSSMNCSDVMEATCELHVLCCYIQVDSVSGWGKKSGWHGKVKVALYKCFRLRNLWTTAKELPEITLSYILALLAIIKHSSLISSTLLYNKQAQLYQWHLVPYICVI